MLAPNRELATNLFGEVKRHVVAIVGRSMDIVEVLWNLTMDPVAQIVSPGNAWKLEPRRPLGRSGNRKHEGSILWIQGAYQ